jgi:hypothetical protein
VRSMKRHTRHRTRARARRVLRAPRAASRPAIRALARSPRTAHLRPTTVARVPHTPPQTRPTPHGFELRDPICLRLSVTRFRSGVASHGRSRKPMLPEPQQKFLPGRTSTNKWR